MRNDGGTTFIKNSFSNIYFVIIVFIKGFVLLI